MTFQEQDKNTAVIKMYCDIGWWETNAQNMSDTIERLSAIYANIIIRTHCYGGSVFDGNVIYNAIKSSKANITVRIEGVAASMMTIIMCAAATVEIAENGFVMVHCPSGYVSGTAKDMIAASKLLGSMEKNFVKKYTTKTGKPESEIKDLFDGTDHWFDAEDALAMGLVDKVIEPVVEDLAEIETPTAGTDPATIYNRYAALLADASHNDLPISKTGSMKRLLITMFGLEGVNEQSSDEQIAEAMKKKVDNLENQITAQATVHVDELIATAETTLGKPFEAAYKATLQTVGLKAGVPALQTMLGNSIPTPQAAALAPAASAPQTPVVMNLLAGAAGMPQGGANDRASWTWDDYQTKAVADLQAMSKANPTAFKALYKAKYGTEPEL